MFLTGDNSIGGRAGRPICRVHIEETFKDRKDCSQCGQYFRLVSLLCRLFPGSIFLDIDSLGRK